MLYLRELSDSVVVQFLCHAPSDEQLALMQEHHMDLDVRHDWLTKENIDKMHALGITVNCWTVDDPDRAADLVEWGIDYITSNILE